MKQNEMKKIIKQVIEAKKLTISQLKPSEYNPTVMPMIIKHEGYLQACEDVLDMINGNTVAIKMHINHFHY